MPRGVIGLGQASCDLIGLVDRYPDLETMVDLREFSMQGGGTVANALATLAVLGDTAGLAATVGDDVFGQFIVKGLQSIGVDVSRVEVQPNKISPICFIAVERGSRRHAVFRTAGNIEPLAADRVDSGFLEGAKALLVDGFQAPAQIAACEQARSRGVPVVLDAGSLRGGLGELVALCDVLIASERFATEIAPRGEIEDSLLELCRMGPRIAIVTLGSEGAVGLEDEKLVRIDALQVPDAVDSTGAGDVYRGAFLYGFVRRWSLEKSMQFANAAAGLNCRALGARAGLPTLEEVKQAAWGGAEP